MQFNLQQGKENPMALDAIKRKSCSSITKFSQGYIVPIGTDGVTLLWFSRTSGMFSVGVTLLWSPGLLACSQLLQWTS